MKKLIALFFIVSLAHAQDDLRIGDPELKTGMPLGTKIIDVGFKNWQYLNVSTVNETDYLLIRWDKFQFDETVKRFKIVVGVPKCEIIRQNFGLIALDSLFLPMACFNFISPREVGTEKSFLLKVSKFDYVVQIIADDGNGVVKYLSQIRYIKQKRKH